MSALTFTPDGLGHALYTETIDLSAIGPLSVRRATSIEYDDALQAWRVRDPSGFPLFTAPSRQQCLDWERLHLEHQEDAKHGPPTRVGAVDEASAPCTA